MKPWLFMIGLVVAIVAVVGGIWGYHMHAQMQMFASMGNPKQTVSTTTVAELDWQPTLEAIGTLRAVRGADLSSEVAGIVESIDFESGDDAKAGQLLVQLRAEDDVAHLNALKASADLAASTYKRDQAQFEAKAISQETLDTDAANLKSAQAQVAQQQALLDKKSIRAPFAGKIGVRAVDVGQYLNPGTKIVTLQQLDPIYVDFNLPQQDLAQLARDQVVTATSDAWPGVEFKGAVASIDAQVDPDTRNILVRATLKNPQHRLLPGMFASVRVDSGSVQHYLTLPQTAITYNPYGETVFVVRTAAQLRADEADKAAVSIDDSFNGGSSKPKSVAPAPGTDDQQLVVEQEFVTTGPTRGDQVAILKGLKTGDVVVTSGQLKLKTGTAIVINNTVQPTDDAQPKPAEQ